MNAFFCCQTRTLKVYYDLFIRQQKKGKMQKAGFFVAGSDYYREFLKEVPDFEQVFLVVKEWECLEAAAKSKPADISFLQAYDSLTPEANVFAACMGDRRIYQGPTATFRQDYTPAYSYEEMLKILEVTLRKMEEVFEKLRPQVTTSLYPAMYADLLTYLLSKKHKISHLDLRLARIKNYVMFGEGLYEPSSHMVSHYETFLAGKGDSQIYAAAGEYLQDARKNQIVYEGAVAATVVNG